MSEPNTDDLSNRLTAEQFNVTQNAATERAFSGKYWDEKRSGTYKCVVCGEPLFSSDSKFDSGSGWPSFTTPIQGAPIDEHTDRALGMVRTESICSNCGAHLGHVFDDGPSEQGGLRYCINSASLELDPEV